MRAKRVNNDKTAAPTTKKSARSDRKKSVADFNRRNRPNRERFFVKERGEQSSANSQQQTSNDARTPTRSESNERQQASEGGSSVNVRVRRRSSNDKTATPTTKKGVGSNRKVDFNRRNRPKQNGFFAKGRSPVPKEQASASSQQSSNEAKTPSMSESNDKMPSADDAKEKEKSKLSDLMTCVSKGLIEHPWYHGIMPREENNDLLKVDGDFLVRKSKEENDTSICVSVRSGDDVRHILLNYENGLWSLKTMEINQKFFELVELLNYLVIEKLKIPPTDAILIRAISRPKYYILHDDIKLVKKLGSGAFGQVWKGIYTKRKDKKEMEVAVKKMKANPKREKIVEFVKEARLMRKLKHQNIVQVIGVAPSEEPLMIVLELAENGSLKSYLQKHDCSQDQLLIFCTDAARGMAYLSSQTIIHRDLAARNLLLGPQLEVKIADFGLSEAGKEEIKITKMTLPIRWLSPESIKHGLFTTKTDVWSFGITTWEIYSRCAKDPYDGITNDEVKETVCVKHPPLQAPPDTPSLVARLLLDCFEENPDNRPTFPFILKKLSPNEDVMQYMQRGKVLEEGTGNEPSSNSISRSRGNLRNKKAPMSARPDVPRVLSVRPDLPKPSEALPVMSTRAVRMSAPAAISPTDTGAGGGSLVDTQILSAPRLPPVASKRLSSPDTRLMMVQTPPSRMSRRKRM